MGKPNAPSNIKINGDDEAENLATKAMHKVTIKGKVTDTDGGQVRLVVRYQSVIDGEYGRVIERRSDKVKSGDNASVVLKDLKADTKYEAKCFTADTEGKVSKQYNGISWWMNRRATTEAVSPAENAQHDVSLPLAFDWKYTDPDGGQFEQNRWELRWRVAATPERLAGRWRVRSGNQNTSEYTVEANEFKENLVYEWEARGEATDGQWSHWSPTRSFTTLGEGRTPILNHPINGEAIVAADTNTFRWRFRDPLRSDTQIKADIRYRAVGATTWIELLGDATTPGANQYWAVPGGTFAEAVEYEWEARTYDASSGGNAPSSWSETATFWGIASPNTVPIIEGDSDSPALLGCGTHRAFIFDRGGKVLRGEITPNVMIRWKRIRDDISEGVVITNGFSRDCGELLASTRCWMHELVIYRDDVRVFEGPITRLTYKRDQVEVEAKDVMGYVYRRILRQGYNDSFRVVKRLNNQGEVVEKQQLGLSTVVARASKIIQNCLAYSDPNVLPYLTVINRPDDARQSRVVADYSKTAWEEVDDLAANAGLDYATLGRRIILWDTHTPLGVLPELSDKNFNESLIVSEYGMNLSNHFAVTDGTGVYGEARPGGTHWHYDAPSVKRPIDQFDYYGPIEMLASSYGAAGATGLTSAQRDERASRVASYAEQARRNISDRWPTPLVVRLPDNSTMHPNTPVAINHLVPGVWLPLRAEETLRKVAGWQKLDRVEVEEVEGVESVRVTMSPAPNGGDDDPDSTSEGEA